ncbi:MAG TPA: 2-hydroxyacid dehydrogenase [Burkholderiaceae bacterium]|jgi:phosphoglycerate dehydrogenase-like enzyme|nr:2-hydroxyacid dehydrogenase [Burkholderiaceae bacterium]
MNPRVVVVTQQMVDEERVRQMVPDGLDLVISSPADARWVEVMGQAEYLVGFVDMLVKPELFRIAPRLRLIQLLSAGYDRADIAAARKAGVPMSNNGGANAVAVSEHALMFMLGLSRQLLSQHAHVVAGRWRGPSTPRLHELRGQTLGIVGMGTIGKKTARLAQAFGMRVRYYDIARLPEDVEDALDVRFRLFGELLRDSDVVSLHVPLNDSTRAMVGEAELARMKPTALLINTSRGPVVDERALHRALASRSIAGAGLDVYEVEPPPADHPLFGLDNVLLTAHMAGPTQESNPARLRNAFDNVQRVIRGEAPLWVAPELSA